MQKHEILILYQTETHEGAFFHAGAFCLLDQYLKGLNNTELFVRFVLYYLNLANLANLGLMAHFNEAGGRALLSYEKMDSFL